MGLFDFFKKKGNTADSLLAKDTLNEFSSVEKQRQDSETQFEEALQAAILQIEQKGGLDNFVPKGEFGYEITNPIMVTNVANGYHYLNRLECVNGNPIEYSRIGSMSNSSFKSPIDMYNIKNAKTGEKFRNIYVYAYGKEMSMKTPTGLRFK